MFNEQNAIAIRIVKGGAKTGDIHGVDALSGATLTSNGVERTLHFWLGNEGYGPFIANIRHKIANGGLN
jgi:Na+-transporting NADH:ubiquinone oxidoreductase subunit C